MDVPGDGDGANDCVRVAVRIRPMIGREQFQKCEECITVSPTLPNQVRDRRTTLVPAGFVATSSRRVASRCGRSGRAHAVVSIFRWHCWVHAAVVRALVTSCWRVLPRHV